MTSSEGPTLWDKIPEYRRRNPGSTQPPSERIDPDTPGAHFWVILAKNWEFLHPLMQDVLTEWYYAITNQTETASPKLDPQSIQGIVNRLNELDDEIAALDIERANLEEELSIRERDFQRLRAVTGKKEKQNIEVQQELGESFQQKIIKKQEELDECKENVANLTQRVTQLEEELKQKTLGTPITEETVLPESLSRDDAITALEEKLSERNNLINEQADEIRELMEQVETQNEKLVEYSAMTKGLREKIDELEGKNKEYLTLIQQLKEENRLKDVTIRHIRGLLEE
ncbi:MAG: hypothetical protein GF308_17375 [Candidatus Heimdallarchaeota archaeon]|nr:hypothetical protein [Candidatus Heimdallarchaeota archaeon]